MRQFLPCLFWFVGQSLALFVPRPTKRSCTTKSGGVRKIKAASLFWPEEHPELHFQGKHRFPCPRFHWHRSEEFHSSCRHILSIPTSVPWRISFSNSSMSGRNSQHRPLLQDGCARRHRYRVLKLVSELKTFSSNRSFSNPWRNCEND